MSIKKPRRNCKNCGKECSNHTKIYCNNKCQAEYELKERIDPWLAGENVEISIGVIRRYLMIKQERKCSECGWSKINPVTGNVPLELEHIDGDWRNNSPNNVKLICPNCHSITPTFRALNKRKHDRKVVGKRKKWD